MDVASIHGDFCKADGNSLRLAFPSGEVKGSFAARNAAYAS